MLEALNLFTCAYNLKLITCAVLFYARSNRPIFERDDTKLLTTAIFQKSTIFKKLN